MSAEPGSPRAATDTLADVLGATAILPVLRAPDVATALATVDELVDAGLSTIELTTTIPDWPSALRLARARHPGVDFGMGTVWSDADATAARDGGADFLVSPGQAPSVREIADGASIPFLEGGLTPTEVLGAARRGIAKLFPAHSVGPSYLRDLLAVSPGARIVPTGGVGLDQVGEWLEAGALAVGVGSDLTASSDLRGRVAEAQRANLRVAR